MTIRIGRVLLAAVAAALVAWSAAADDVGGEGVAVPSGGSTVVEQLLDIMLASGQITQQQYDALMAKAREEQEEAAIAIAQAARETPDVSEQGPTWNFKWKNKFRLERSDGAFKLSFGGRVMIDQASIWESNGLRNNLPGSRDGTGVECRRCRIFFAGTVYDRAIFKVAYDFQDDDDPEFKDIWIGVKDLGFVERVQLGQFKEPFNLEEWTSSKYLTFMERGLNNVFFPGRNVGVAFMGNLVGKRMYWQTGLFYDVDDRAFGFDDWGEQNYDLTARLVGVPIYSDDGTKVLHLGAGYIHQFRDKDSAGFRYRQRPESDLAARFADTGVLLGVDGTDVFDIELAGVFGPFSAQAEFTGSAVSRANESNPFFWGAYAYVSWFITGEHRNYELGKGRFGRTKLKENFNPFRGGWGAWELAARFSYLDLTNSGVRGGEMWDVTAGINWYLYPNLRVMLNYVHANLTQRQIRAAGSGNIFQTRFQIDF